MALSDESLREFDTAAVTAGEDAPPADTAHDCFTELDTIRSHQRGGQHAEAAARARAALARHPDHRDLLLALASSLRHRLLIDEAMPVVDRLIQIHPRFSLAHQERGLCHVARRDAPAAIAALLRAVNLNPALPMAWRMLEGVYKLSGDNSSAATAAGHVATLRALPGEVIAATSLFSDGELDQSERIVRQFLLTRGDHPEAMRLLAKIGMAHEVYDDAELLLEGVLAMLPGHRAACYEYAQCLSLRHKHLEARKALAPLLDSDPDNREYRTLASTIAIGLGEQEEAIRLYRGLLEDLPEIAEDPLDGPALISTRADLHLWLGHALKTIGNLPEAIEHYRMATAIRPDFGDAWWSLANLKTYRFDDVELDTMGQREADAATGSVDRIHLAFALGKAHEDRGDHVSSWDAYVRGNSAKRATSNYRPEVFETNTREQKRTCTAAFFAERQGWGSPAAAPIFVLGLPRSGSTLIEQILASHSQVEGTQELPDIQRLVLELQGRDPDLDNPRYPAALADLSRDDAIALGERYLESTRAYRALGRPFFVDKMPNNFRHIGFIHLILPNARIIDARREPMACCFSNFKQLFAQGQEFTYSIEDIARYYRTYLDLMRHWDEVLPGRVLRLCNEDLVAAPEHQTRRLLEHCGLPFEEQCLSFHENRRAVRTPSSEQVRRPISRDGLEQWRPYSNWLEPLWDALGDALTSWRA